MFKVTDDALSNSTSAEFSKPSEERKRYSFFRSSLFSYVPPTVRFVHPNGGKIEKPRKLNRKLTKWCYNSLTPKVVRRTLMNSHFEIVPDKENWIGYWGRHLKTVDFKKILPYQKVNHFPGAFNLGRKDKLWTNIDKHAQAFPNDNFEIMPKTFILPRDSKLLKEKLQSEGQLTPVILKPPASARGCGVRVVNRWRQIPRRVPLVVQTYIEHPYLIKGSKFDLRLYVYVTSFDPLKLYLFEDGLVRFASVKYSKSLSSISNRLMHLTNYSLNKDVEHDENLPNKSETGVKWSLKKLWSYLAASSVDVACLQRKIEDLIVKTFICCCEPVNEYVERTLSFPFVCHELYGLDVVLDEALRPWLLEVNISPSLHTAASVDVDVKSRLAPDVLNLAGIRLPDASWLHSTGVRLPVEFSEPKKNFSLDYRTMPQTETILQVLDGADVDKRRRHEDYFHQNNAIDPNILEHLTANDLRLLIDFEDEFERRGKFRRIFPAVGTTAYLKFFPNARYCNLLLDEWINQYSHIRNTGLSLIESLCRQKRHVLQVSH